MDLVQAAQLVFSNVEADQSPTGKRGIQTLFHSRSELSPAEVREIEAHLFYPANGARSPKHVFFRLQTGKIALAQIVALDDPDGFQRRGRSFAHALVFLPSAFALFDNNPFRLLLQYPFYATVEDAFGQGDRKTGELAPEPLCPASYPPRRGVRHLDLPQSTQDLSSLLVLAAQAAMPDTSGQSICFSGTSETFLQLLDALFTLLPPQVRLSCSFDTLFVGGMLHKLRYWAIGLPSNERRPGRVIAFDLRSRTFEPSALCVPTTTFEHWLVAAANECSLDSIAVACSRAFVIAAHFDGYGSDPGDLAHEDERFLGDFLVRSQFDVDGYLCGQLKRQTGPALAKRLLPSARQWVDAPGDARLLTVSNGYPTGQLADWLATFYTSRVERPEEQELRELEAVLPNLPDAPIVTQLRLVYLRWGQQWKRLALALRNVDEPLFEQFTLWALQTAEYEITWATQCYDRTLLMGPCISFSRSAQEESMELIMALLDAQCGDAGPGDLSDLDGAPGFGARMWTFGAMVRNRVWRSADTEVPAPFSPQHGVGDRWRTVIRLITTPVAEERGSSSLL